MHAKGILQHSPVLADLIEGEPTADTIRLSTLVDIEVKPANFRTVRSITAVAAIADEIAFWQIEGAANPDSEILNALRPSLATTGGPLFVISSPYAKRGELYGTYRRDYGANGDPAVLVAKGASREFNSTLPQRVVDRAYARDAAAAASEYGGEFRTDVQAFIDRDVVDACVSPGVTERRPVGWVTYFAFVDPSGGSNDAMTLRRLNLIVEACHVWGFIEKTRLQAERGASAKVTADRARSEHELQRCISSHADYVAEYETIKEAAERHRQRCEDERAFHRSREILRNVLPGLAKGARDAANDLGVEPPSLSEVA